MSCDVVRQNRRMRTRWDDCKIVAIAQTFIFKWRFPLCCLHRCWSSLMHARLRPRDHFHRSVRDFFSDTCFPGQIKVLVEWCPCLHDLVSSELKQRTFLHDGDATARKTLVRGCSFSRQNVSKQTRHTDKEVKDLLQNWILWNTSSFKAVRKLLPVAHESKIIMLKNSLLYLNNFPYNSYKRLQLEKIQVPLS